MIPVAAAVLLTLASAPNVRADDVTVSQNDLRTGWDPNESALSPSAVGGGGFGQLFSTAVNGQVYAQPLVVGTTLIAATENDRVYGLNSSTGAIEWSTSLGTPWPTKGCGDLTPDVGVTSTPVYDPASRAVYLVAATVVNSAVQYDLFGVSARTGSITERVAIGGTPTNDADVTFDAAQQWQRPGLLIMNGWVYAGFASHCDQSPYDGFIAGVNVRTRATTLWSDETGVADDQAGIWQSGGGLMSDGPGRIFFMSGNGVSPVPGPGNSPPGQLAESVVRLSVQPDGSLAAQDFFSPQNAASLDSRDADFGSGAPVALPFGTRTYPHLMTAIGKDGHFYLLNRDNLGGRDQGQGGGDAALRVVCCWSGEWGEPATFAGTATLGSHSATAHDFLYYAGNGDYLREMSWAYGAGGIPAPHTVATSSVKFGYTSGSPVVTSSGTNPTSAVVWVVGASGKTGAGGTLYAYQAVPPSTCTAGSPCALAPLWSAPIGTASKFTVPATDGGRIYVGTRDGHVLGFGMLPGRFGAALRPQAPVGFGPTNVGGTASQDVAVTASSDTTVTGVTVDSPATALTTGDPFHAGPVTETAAGGTTRVPVTFPVALAAGDTLHVQVGFTPSSPGGVVGTVSFAVPSAHVNVPLSGDGVQPGLYPTAGSLSLPLSEGTPVTTVPVGLLTRTTVEITNGGRSAQMIRSVTPPTGPFSADLPAPGTVLQPGQSVTVQVTFAPRQAGPASGSFTVTGDSGTAATVDLSGVGVAAVSRLAVSPAAVDFGSVPAGAQATAVIHIGNAGNQPAAVATVAPLADPFAAPDQLASGLVVNSGDDLVITVTFDPVSPGRFTGRYRLTWTDRSGHHTAEVPLKGAATR